MARETIPIAGVLVDEEDEGVVIAGFEIDTTDLADFFNDALGEEEAHDEDFVIAGGAHQDRERAAIDDDLEWLFYGEVIIASLSLPFDPAGDFDG